jgi:hypothetical protein
MDLHLATKPERLLLLGFDWTRWERRKAELRARLVKEHAASSCTVKSRQQIEAENASYWTSGGMSYLRLKYADEAEFARQRRKKIPEGKDTRGADQTQSLGHLELKTDTLKVRLIAEESGVGLFEESKDNLVYGYTLAIMSAKNRDYGRTAWYLPNWAKEYVLAAMPKLGAELVKPKSKQRPWREVLNLHRKEWWNWLTEKDPLSRFGEGKGLRRRPRA